MRAFGAFACLFLCAIFSVSAEDKPGVETLTGTLRHKPWTKSAESYAAGGSDYFLLEAGGTPTATGKSVVVLPSEKVTKEALTALKDKSVTIKGEQVEGTVRQPNPNEQYQVGPDGKPLQVKVGGGFKALEITEVPGK